MPKKKITESLSPSLNETIPSDVVQSGLAGLSVIASGVTDTDESPKIKRGRPKKVEPVPEAVPLDIDPMLTGQLLVVIGGILARVRKDERWKPNQDEIRTFGMIMNAVLGRYLPSGLAKHKELVSLGVFGLGYATSRIQPAQKVSDQDVHDAFAAIKGEEFIKTKG